MMRRYCVTCPRVTWHQSISVVAAIADVSRHHATSSAVRHRSRGRPARWTTIATWQLDAAGAVSAADDDEGDRRRPRRRRRRRASVLVSRCCDNVRAARPVTYQSTLYQDWRSLCVDLWRPTSWCTRVRGSVRRRGVQASRASVGITFTDNANREIISRRSTKTGREWHRLAVAFEVYVYSP